MDDIELLIILSTIIILFVVSIMFTIYSFFLRKKNELLFAQKAKETYFQNELSAAHVEIREQTLNYIGQELHDNIGQKLSVAKMITNRIPKNSEISEDPLPDLQMLLGECIHDIRNLSKTFITDSVADDGLIESLERELARIKKLNLLKVNFECEGQVSDLNATHTVILYRMIQECLNNVLKHSQATKIDIIVKDFQQKLSIKLSDNGKGFMQDKNEGGSGIKNMTNRAKMIDADFKIFSKKDIGTTVTIEYQKKLENDSDKNSHRR